MRKIFGGVPPRYFTLLRLSLAAAVLRGIPWIPFCLAYFLPLGEWSRLLIVLSPLLWVVFVGPARIRYAEMMVAYARDARAPIRIRGLFSMNRAWWPVVRGRVQLTYRWMLPLLVLLAVLLPMLWLMNPFSAIRILVDASAFVATAAATAVAALPRLLMGESPVVQGGIAGGAVALTVVAAAALLLFVWGMFQTGAYRFGYTRMPKPRDVRPLMRKNLALWLPTLILFFVFAAFAFSELMLLLANVISAEAVFTVKLRPPQIALLSLTVVSYLLLLPLRKRNTAAWVTERS